ncbi:MAG: pilus assembly protein N-terminal domain-containing protein [Spirochaetales bacterium]|jgi:pilus assembly protein CpaC|nr:pilus assembly protein N-terminal domain-containing protein [Spirochaetales bacterium]
MKPLFYVVTALFILACGSSLFAAPTPITLSVGENYIVDIVKNKNTNVQVVSPNIIEVKKFSATQLAFRGLKIGKTLVKIWDNNDYKAEYLVNVEIENVRKRKVSDLIDQLCLDGKVTFVLTPAKGDNNGQLILQGSVPHKSLGERLDKLFTALEYKVVNLLSIEGTQQVQLFVRVAEVVKGNPMSIGVNIFGGAHDWNMLAPGSDLLTNLAIGIPGIDSIADGTVTGQMVGATHGDAFQLGVNFSGIDYSGVLSLMEGHNLAKILAQPTLVVDSGQSARFHAGGEFAISTTNNDGDTNVDFKKYGVLLAFTPDILENGNIHITLNQEVSNLDWANSVLNIPGLRVRKTETSIKLRDGESFMVSGLLQEEIRSLVTKVPLLGDLPILGALFRSSTYEKNQTELAVVVTPRIVNPIAAGEEISLPGEQLTTPSAFEAFLLGKVVKRTNEKAAYALLGPAGLEMP